MTTRPTESFLFRYATGIAIGAVTLVMISAVIMFWWQWDSRRAAKAWLVHTYQVIAHIELLFGKVVDAETGQRGYLVTGNEEYLEPYQEALRDDTAKARALGDNASKAISDSVDDAAKAEALRDASKAVSDSLVQHRSITQEVAAIRQLTSDNLAQQSYLDEMDDLLGKLLPSLASTIEQRKAQNTDAANAKLDLHHGKEMMDHFRNLVRVMIAEEVHLLALRNDADEFEARQGNELVFSVIALFYISMTLSVWLYQKIRAQTQAQLARYVQELEKSEEELKMQQEELKASNEEMEASNEELEEKSGALEEQNAQIQQQSEELAESKRLIEEKAGEVERASKYKSEFLANMSHELRTPLNSLLILAGMLAANEEGNLTELQIEEARVIHNAGLELLGLINDILDLSKVEAGKLTLVAEELSLDGIVKRLQQQFSPMARESGVAFPIVVGEDTPTILHTDAQRLEQTVKNLLSNAFKFTERGSVTLKVYCPDQKTELRRTSLERGSTIAFSVIDTGIGIEASKLKDIFEAFQQEDGSTDRHYGGTGLGLTIARKFAHMLGGEIHVTSKKGVGSTFTLVMPVRLAVADTQDTQEVGAPAEGSDEARIELKSMPLTTLAEFIADDRRVIGEKDKVLLIVEDDRHFAATLMKIARQRGYKCLVAGDGKTGLLLAVGQRVTAVILDLKLPDIDGNQVLDQLKHDLRTRHIPVHIISGRDQTHNVLPLRKGAIGYLSKPVGKKEIDGAFTRIEELLASEVKQVLVIEDDKNSQVAIQSLLGKKEIAITLAATGSAALEQVRSTRFDCIILDLRLPDMTGFEWLEKMEKQAGRTETTPVVVYTAKELTEEENRLLNRYTGSIIIKGAKSPERLLDEVTLFLHSVESTLSKDQREIIRMQHNPDKVLEGRTVLLTDDDLRNTFALSKLLKTHGMNVVIADNGQMALEKLRADRSIELVIMDIMMPIMDGYKAMQEIRAQKLFSSLPIIALTARAMPEEQEKCMAAGANDYLAKPVDIERLLTLLRVWLFRQEIAA